MEKEYTNSDIQTLFRKYDELENKVDSLENFVNNELGYRSTPAIPESDGYVWKDINRLNSDLYGNSKMGIKTKMFLITCFVPVFFLIFGSLATKLITDYFGK